MSSLKGKKLWLIGASVGIGEALAHRLAASGVRLALSARSGDKVSALAQSLPGGPHLPVTADVTNPESLKTAWAIIESAWTTIDIVIYNAGAYEPMSAQKFDLKKTEEMVDVNFHGALRALDCVLPAFLARKDGHIVLVASAVAYGGLPNSIGYGASKAALLHLAENLKLDLRSANIKVQVVNPGFVKTRLTDKNAFPMPFIMTADAAAKAIEAGLAKDRFEIYFPKRLAFILKTLRLMPYSLYFRLLKNV